MDSYPAADPIPDPALVDSTHGELVNFLTNSREMRQTAKSALKQSLYAGGGALAGGFLLGPVGGLIGGITGSVIGFFQSDDYDGAVLAICKLEGEQRRTLMQSIAGVLVAAGATAQQFENSDVFHTALVDLASQPRVREQLWQACSEAIR